MKYRIGLGLLVLFIFVPTVVGQIEITIKKKSSMKIPGLPEMPKAGMKNPMDSMENRKSTVFIKGSRMRTDMAFNQQDGKAPMIQTNIVQCDKQRTVTFNSKQKKYYLESLAASTSAGVKNLKKGGYVTVAGSVTDTGERAKLFGYNARHLKETITFTPSKNACMKDAMQIEIEGWYADIPEFSCPIQRKMSEFKMDNNCFDDVDFQMKGSITGVALKEIKTIKTKDMAIIMEEETVEILKTPLSDAIFEPPTNYKAANTLKEVEDDSPDDTAGGPDSNYTTTPSSPSSASVSKRPSFDPPAAGLERVTGVKKAGMIRIGIAKPKVTTPDTKKNPESGSDIATAAANSLLESLKGENVEAIILDSDLPENEGAEKGCDYIFFATVTQKRGGGGMFGKMIAMGAVSVAGAFIPGIGGMVASTIASQVMSQTMMKNSKAKDEFTLDYKVQSLDKSVLTQSILKNKAGKDGDDVLTPQIQQASKAVLGEIAKKKPL